jgi:hypothetical protein
MRHRSYYLVGAEYALFPSRRSPSKGARNAGPHRTRVLQDLAILKRSLVVERDSAETSAFRARCLVGLLQGHPGGVTIFYPPLTGSGKPEAQYAVP